MRKFFVALVWIGAIGVVFAKDLPYQVPAAGSKERASILNAIRPSIEKQVGQKVKLFVRSIAVKDDYALVFVIPQDVHGQWLKTKNSNDNWFFSLLERNNNSWKPLDTSLSDGGVLDQWKKKYQKAPAILFEAVGTATNADEAP